jgi:putative hydrolase of the HAD superfamily
LNRCPEALLLDALGTLLALNPPAPRLRRVLSDQFGVSISERDAERAIAAEIAYYRSHLNEGRDARTLAALRQRCADAMGEALPNQARERLDRNALVSALLSSLEFSVFDDVRPTLRAFRRRGVALIVVSNWDVSLPDVLRRVELSPLLDGVVTSAALGSRKPATAIFERALGMTGAAPDHAIHVGDSVVEDIEGARDAGIKAILVRRDGGRGPAGVITIGSLAELPRAIECLSDVAKP